MEKLRLRGAVKSMVVHRLLLAGESLKVRAAVRSMAAHLPPTAVTVLDLEAPKATRSSSKFRLLPLSMDNSRMVTVHLSHFLPFMSSLRKRTSNNTRMETANLAMISPGNSSGRRMHLPCNLNRNLVALLRSPPTASLRATMTLLHIRENRSLQRLLSQYARIRQPHSLNLSYKPMSTILKNPGVRDRQRNVRRSRVNHNPSRANRKNHGVLVRGTHLLKNQSRLPHPQWRPNPSDSRRCQHHKVHILSRIRCQSECSVLPRKSLDPVLLALRLQILPDRTLHQ